MRFTTSYQQYDTLSDILLAMNNIIQYQTILYAINNIIQYHS